MKTSAPEPSSPPAAFECRRCGHCCRGVGGIILSPRDIARLADHLGLPEPEFLKAHTETVNSRIRLKTGADEYCIFYDEGCGVHPGRPDICRAWPFFRGNILDKDSWEMIQDYCPGVNASAGHAEFARQGRAYLESLKVRDLGDNAPQALKLPED